MPQLVCYDSNNFLVVFALINRTGRKHKVTMTKTLEEKKSKQVMKN